MAAPHLNLADALNTYQLEITEMKRAGYTYNEILSRLQETGVRVSLSTISRQLRDCGLRRRTEVTVSDEDGRLVLNITPTTRLSLSRRR